MSSRPNSGGLRQWLASDVVGGALLITAAALGLGWANSPWQQAFHDLAGIVVGPAALHLDLSLSAWAADGLLAVFFLVVGLELKHEFVAGSLRSVREAAVPVLAAVGGMAVPALLYVAVVVTLHQPEAVGGWAIPTATDFAFALAVLAVFGRGLPVALRLFLLTLAVVDDLLAIMIIAVFYTETIHPLELALAIVAVAGFGVAVRLRRLRWWLLVPLALVAWALMHASGVHATIAGVLLGFTVPAFAVHGEAEARTHRIAHAVQPWSTGIALPVFAFFAAGVTPASDAGPLALFGDPVLVGVVVGLVVGKVVGVLGVTALVTRFTPLRLPDSIGLRDLLPVGFLTGIGFTVSLLIAELSFPGSGHGAAAKVGVLLGTAGSAVFAALLLRWDAHRARSGDMNADGVPDTGTETI